MDPIVPPTAGTAPQSAPLHLADRRPAADAAALARDPSPDLPLPPVAPTVPPSSVQGAAVTRSLLAAGAAEGVPAVPPVERVLKPYGITMLPSEAARARAEAAARAGQTDPACDRAAGPAGGRD
jgi:hypothetical protein